MNALIIEQILAACAVRHIWVSAKRITILIAGLTGLKAVRKTHINCTCGRDGNHCWRVGLGLGWTLLAAFGSPAMNWNTFLCEGDFSNDSLSAVGSVDKTVAICLTETRFRDTSYFSKTHFARVTSLSEMSPLEALENCPTTAFITCGDSKKNIKNNPSFNGSDH